MTRPGIEPRSSGLLVNTLLMRPMTRFSHKVWKDNDAIKKLSPDLGDKKN